MPNVLKLELTNGLFALCDSDLAEDFCKVFISVWLQLPEIVRSVFLQHWKRRPDSPVIQFHSFSSYQGGVSGGNVRDDGNDIRYNADIFGFMSPPLRNAVIAHELGHVFLIALREPIHVDLNFNFEIAMSCEFVARHLNQLWGFDQLAVEEWLERELCDGIPYLRSTAGEDSMSEDEYKQVVERMLLKWGTCRGCESVQAAQSERDRLLREKAAYFELGTMSDSELSALKTHSIDELEKVAHGLQSLTDLRI